MIERIVRSVSVIFVCVLFVPRVCRTEVLPFAVGYSLALTLAISVLGCFFITARIPKMHHFLSAITHIPALIAWFLAAIHLVLVLESYSVISKAFVLQFGIPIEAISLIPEEALSSDLGRKHFLEILRLLAVQGLLSAVLFSFWVYFLVKQIVSYSSTEDRLAT